ncbi:hypothetical protein JB92DRAFT_3109283 [Gautieria morchelliformis]|nr:hypothetical protein JB92DRAFT_3109283 [Gautieria morchelliformis]
MLLLLAVAFLVARSAAQIVAVPFANCSAARTPTSLDISAVYAQLDTRTASLNYTFLGSSPAQIDYASNSSLLSTVLNPSSLLTFALNPGADSQSLCRSLRPPSPLPQIANDSQAFFCPLPPGQLAFSVATPLQRRYELVTITTQVRVLDDSSPAQELACVELSATPLHPTRASVYGHAAIVFWVSVALTAAYWLLVAAARLAAASKRGRQRVHANLWSRVQGLGFVAASAISGERFASSPALLRFGTPSMRDVLFHTQWCALLGMLTVQWPRFAYPFFAQTAWATLLYNISLTPHASHWDPLNADPFSPPPAFADQLADPASPLFLDPTIPNTLFTLPRDFPTTGIPALASSVGIRPQDAFDVSVGLFVLVVAGTLVLSVLVFALDWLFASCVRASSRASGTRTPPWASAAHKEFLDAPEFPDDDPTSTSGTVRFSHRPASRTFQTSPVPRGWLSYRLGQSSFHGSVLHGNLVRLLVLFHLPVTVFACFQFTQGPARSSVAAVVLATLAFAFFSLALPAWLLLRVATTPTSKLYDETRTLLMLGPLYNHYAHGAQRFAALPFATNLAYGLALGCGQRSGTAQAIIVLFVEVAAALTTSVYLPWGRGAAMGGVSFTLCVARIITAVLLVILTPAVSVGAPAAGWIAYAILFIQALVYLFLFLILVSKLAEAAVRVVWRVAFGRSKHTVDAGLLGAIALAGCGGRRKGKAGRGRASRESDSTRGMLRPVSPGATAASRRTMSALGTASSPAANGSPGGPPSVLRPEQLTQPYREESDDEGGYILGAWHYDDEAESPSAASSPVSLSASAARASTPAGASVGRASTPTGASIRASTPAGASVRASTPPTPAARAPASSSGFSRVAGGRANLESPFTMSAVGRAAGAGASKIGVGPGSGKRNAGGGAGNAGGAAGGGAGSPASAPAPAAMPLGRVRRKSQSAIIEVARGEAPTGAHMDAHTDAHANAPAMDAGSRSAVEIAEFPRGGGRGSRRRRWLGLFARGERADDDEDADEDEDADALSGTPVLQPDAASSASAGGSREDAAPAARTFVVIRDRRTRPSPLSQTHTQTSA